MRSAAFLKYKDSSQSGKKRKEGIRLSRKLLIPKWNVTK